MWRLQLIGDRGEVLAAADVHNDILSSGRRDAIRMLTGLASLGVYQWIELGQSSQPTAASAMRGCQQPLLIPASTVPYRTQGTWAPAGSDATLSFVVPGSEVTGTVREAALYPSRVGGAALFRIVLPSALILGSSNTLTGAVNLVS